MGLESLIPPTPDFRQIIARVISVSGHTLMVDLGGPVQVLAVDGCNPRPNDSVVILVSASSMTAIAAVGGPYRQSKMTVTANATNTVTGVINGVSTAIPKSGTFTATVGQDIPLFWSADGAIVWALPNEQQATSGPPPGGGSGGTPGGVTTGKSTYPPTSRATWSGTWHTLAVPVTTSLESVMFYGASRFRELQGRTITQFRAFLPGAGTVSVFGHPHAGTPGGAPTHGYSAGSVSMGNWVSLPIGLANYLIAGSGTGGIALTGSYNIVPSGQQLEFSWRR